MRPGPGRRVVSRYAASLLVSAAVPLLAYVLLRPHVQSDTTALLIAAVIPTGYTAGVLLWRRRLDPVGVIAVGGFAVGGFAVGLLLLVATGGSELAFKLRDDAWTGPLGLACLVSVVVRRPLLGLVLRVSADNVGAGQRMRGSGARRIAAVATAVIGTTLVVHAVAMIVLALTTNTATFLAVSRPVSWTIVGGGLATLAWWIRHQRPGQHNQSAGRQEVSARQHENTSSGERP